MTAKRNRKVMVPTLALLTLSLTVPAWAGGFSGGVDEALGPRFNAAPQRHAAPSHPLRHGGSARARLHHWNKLALNASGLDHTPVVPGEQRVFGEQYGPTRASRAMAIVHIAIFDAVNAIAGDYDLSFKANATEAANDSADVRFTVETSILGAVIGAALIVAAVGGLYWVFRRYGRR